MSYQINPKVLYQKNACIPKNVLLSELITNNGLAIDHIDYSGVFYTLCIGKDIYELNFTGSLIWEQLMFEKSVKEIINFLKDIFYVEEKDLMDYTKEYIEILLSKEFLVLK